MCSMSTSMGPGLGGEVVPVTYEADDGMVMDSWEHGCSKNTPEVDMWKQWAPS